MASEWSPDGQSKRFWFDKVKKYHLEEDTFRKMFEEQGGRCWICRRVFRSSPNVDHNHRTGQVRGLLCMMCNRGLGRFQEKSEILTKAAEYLRRYE